MTDNDGCGVPRNRDAWTRTGLVEYVDTPDEHTDRFYRHGDWGIEEHNEHEFQVYAVVNGTPVPVKEGLMSFEECVEFIDGASKARKLNDEDCGHGDSDVKDDVKVKIVMKPFRQMMEDIAKAKPNYGQEGTRREKGPTTVMYGGGNIGTPGVFVNPEGEVGHSVGGPGRKSTAYGGHDSGAPTSPMTRRDYEETGEGETYLGPGVSARDDLSKRKGMPPGLEAQGLGNTGIGTNGTSAFGGEYARPELKNAKAFYDEKTGQWKATQSGEVYYLTEKELATMDDNGMVYIDIDHGSVDGGSPNDMPSSNINAGSSLTLDDKSIPASDVRSESRRQGYSDLLSYLPSEFRNMYQRYSDLNDVSERSTNMTALADNFVRDPDMVAAVQRIMANPQYKEYYITMINRARGNQNTGRAVAGKTVGDRGVVGSEDGVGSGQTSSKNPMDSYYQLDPKMGDLAYILGEVIDANPDVFRGLNAAINPFYKPDTSKTAKRNAGVPEDSKMKLFQGTSAPGSSDQQELEKFRKETEGMTLKERNQRIRDEATKMDMIDAQRDAARKQKTQDAKLQQKRAKESMDAKKQAELKEKKALGEKNTSPEATAYSEGMKMFRESMQADARMRGRREPDAAGLDTRFINQYPRNVYGVPGGKPLPPEVAERHARIMAKLENWKRHREGKIPADAGQINPDEKGEYNDLAQQGVADTVNIRRSDEPVSFRKLMEEENLRKSGDQGLPMHFGDRARIEPFREFYRTVTVGSDKQDISTVVDPHRNRSD